MFACRLPSRFTFFYKDKGLEDNIFLWLFFSLMYISIKNNCYFYEFHHTKLFSQTLIQTLLMTLSLFIENFFNHLDSLFLFPKLGAISVSIYYISSLLGKMISLGISPITSMLLSYLAKEQEFPRRLLLKILCISAIMGIIGYVIANFTASPILQILYPSLFEQALPYIKICSLTAITYIWIIILRSLYYVSLIYTYKLLLIYLLSLFI